MSKIDKNGSSSVLIVDDERQILAAVSDILEDDFDILTASSGEEALEIAEENHSISVVLADQRMPKIQGDELLSRLQVLVPATRVLMTGYADLDAVVRAINNGKIFAYVAKPWDEEGLKFVVNKAVERYELSQQLTEERELLHSLLDYSPDGIYFKDREHRYIRCNRRQAQLIGLGNPDDAIGRNTTEYLPVEDAERNQAEEDLVFSSRKPVIDSEMTYTMADGGRVMVARTIAPVLDDYGDVKYLVGVARDITLRKRTEDALRQSEAALQHAEGMARLGHWSWTGKPPRPVGCSGGLRNLVTTIAGRMPESVDEWLANIAESDRATIAEAYKSVGTQSEARHLEYRVIGPGGSSHLHEVIEPSRTEKPSSDAWFSTIQDVTAWKRAQQEIELLLSVTQAVSETNDFEKSFELALERVCTALDWHYGEVWLEEPGKGLRTSRIWAGDPTHFAKFRAATEKFTGKVSRGLVGRVWASGESIWIPDVVSSSEEFFTRREAAIEAGLGAMVAVPIVGSDGAPLAVMAFGHRGALAVDDRAQQVISGVAKQLSELFDRKKAEQALRESEGRLRGLAEHIPGVVFQRFHSPEGTFNYTYVSPRCRDILGREPEEIIADPQLIVGMVHPDDQERMSALIQSGDVSNGVLETEYRIVTKDGAERWLSVTAGGRSLADGSALWDGVLLDVTERKVAEEQLRYLTNYDPLTGLANQSLFRDLMNQAIRQAHRGGDKLALIYISFERLKRVSEVLGLAAGDEILKQVASRLVGVSREGDVLARVSSDEFALLLNGLDGVGETSELLQDITEVLDRPHNIESQSVNVTPNIGVAVFPDDGDEAETLLKHASVACDRARNSEGRRYEFYTHEMNREVVARLTLEGRLRAAVEKGAFELWYQPQIDLRTEAIVGAEALIRWREDDGSLISPGEFIPVAEQTGLIIPMGEWALRKACEDARALRDEGLSAIDFSVNVSGHQLGRPGFAEMVERILAETGMPAEHLKLELTESSIMTRIKGVTDALRALGELGVRLAVDDFGTGYSSLAYLSRLPIDVLKVDRSFVNVMTASHSDAAIVHSVVTLAHSINASVIAEGVESKEQVIYLRAYQCDVAQGFLYAKPLPMPEFRAFLQNGLQTDG